MRQASWRVFDVSGLMFKGLMALCALDTVRGVQWHFHELEALEHPRVPANVTRLVSMVFIAFYERVVFCLYWYGVRWS